MRFIADSNVGKLARWLRVAGFDTLFFRNIDDSRLVRAAFDQDRVLLTKDTGIMKRRLVTSGRLKAILIEGEEVKSQLIQVLAALDLGADVDREAVRELAPPYVFRTQMHYMQCPSCQRLYWRGTHWERMRHELDEVVEDVSGRRPSSVARKRHGAAVDREPEPL